MEIKTLYKYTRPDGGTTVSPNKPDAEYVECFRLIANEGMALTQDSETLFECVDVDHPGGWFEIEYIEEYSE